MFWTPAAKVTSKEFSQKLNQLGAGGLVVAGGPFFVSHREQLAAMALRRGVP